MLKIIKQGTTLEIKHGGYIPSIACIFLLMLLTYVFFSELSFTSFIIFIIFSPILVYASNIFYEGFNLILNIKDKCSLIIYSGFIERKQTRKYEFDLKELKGFLIETRLNTKRVRIVMSAEDTPLTRSFDNIGKLEKMVYEIETWLNFYGYKITINEESVTYKTDRD